MLKGQRRLRTAERNTPSLLTTSPYRWRHRRVLRLRHSVPGGFTRHGTAGRSLDLPGLHGSKASGDFSTTRRRSSSSAGIRALLWATGSAKSLGCSTDSQTSCENIFANILTPDSIPQFTIPSLSVQTSFRSLDKEAQDNEAESEGELRSCGANVSSSSSSSCSSFLLSGRKAERCLSDPLAKRRSFLQRDVPFPPSNKSTLYCLDPTSKAALSLPHLTKVTTPYGFVTLSQSPQMASEEALLCQTGLHRLNSDSKASSAIGGNAEVVKGNCSHLLGAKKKLSKDFPDSQCGESLLRGEPHASPCASSSASSTAKPPDKLKRRFYHIIKKHLMTNTGELHLGETDRHKRDMKALCCNCSSSFCRS
ncbi:hypothetical protein CCH79_00007277 [Gambusia affinis]|uniref:Uncharacterized protein n=1 Tax=Gambusia affinis TaxID=33528 RepID=A0A315VDF2_GAMAF|nr:hypothetical protein CCH79_00007277 [Gambusia affinis]